MKKKSMPVSQVRQILEPGPVVLVSSRYKGQTNIMTMGWHLVMEFSPSLTGCIIANSNHSFEMIRKSKECVINVPSRAMATTVIGIGNCSGADVNKFSSFDLTPVDGSRVSAPLIDECFANFECRLHDAKLVKKYNFFIFEVVRAISTVRHPPTLHYKGDGNFMVSGKSIHLKSEV